MANANHNDMSPCDLGNGYRLVFQEDKTNKNQVRAVVKSPDGTVFVAGPVVDRARAFVSKQNVLFRPERVAWMGKTGAVPLDFDEDENEPEEIDDEEDEEEEADE
jgi:hypothetical protein